ncbi:ribonuclease P protein component [Gordonia sp. VNK21]|uniref:ribonuclease P protein component n=1 Tax=Gordonia sp. VNK21 TaxID=3382483 RepID=UPI0038D4C35B
MSADSSRIARSSDFARTLDKGVRVSARDVVVHLAPVPARWPDPSGIRSDVALAGGPWLGLIVSKKVGNAVVRHATARRLRHSFARHKHLLPDPETYVVLRARPSITAASAGQLDAQLRKALSNTRIQAAFGERGAAAATPVGDAP